MSQQIRVHNPGPYEVVIDDVGHQLAGSTSVTVDADERTAALLDAGLLLRMKDTPVLGPPASDEPVPAIEPDDKHEPVEEEPHPKPARKSRTTKAAASDEANVKTGAK